MLSAAAVTTITNLQVLAAAATKAASRKVVGIDMFFLDSSSIKVCCFCCWLWRLKGKCFVKAVVPLPFTNIPLLLVTARASTCALDVKRCRRISTY